MTSPRKSTEPVDYREAIIRVSRVNGRDGDSFLSPEIQRKLIETDAEIYGYTIRHWWDETASVSGKTTDRKGLKGAMDACMSGLSNGITVARVDRFSRNLPEGLTAIRELHDAGKHFVAVNEGVRGTSTKGANKAVLTLLLLFAEWYLESITEGWLATRESCVERGIALHAPYGYEKGEDRRLKPVQAEAKVVKLIFKLRAKGWGHAVIADHLTEKGIPNPSGGPAWIHSAVSHILSRRTYLGELSNGTFVKHGAHPAIITTAQWDAARQVAATTAYTSGAPDKETALLVGLMRCGSCGGGMRHRHNTVKGVTYEHYRCREKFGWGRCPEPANCVAADIEQVVLDQFAADFLGDVVFGEDVQDDAVLEVALDELAEAEADLTAYVMSPENRRLQRKRPAAYNAGLAECEAAMDAAETAVRELRHQVRGARLPNDIDSLWPTMDVSARREHLSANYGAVVVWPGQYRVRSLEGRVHIFRPDEIDGLPGRGGKDNAITPIDRPTDD